MKLSKIIELSNAKLVAGCAKQNQVVKHAFSSDLMSDVLTLDVDHLLLITGLANVQLVRTAEMADIEVVVLARNKKATPEMIDLANENGLVIIETPYSIFRTSGILFSNGLKPVY